MFSNIELLTCCDMFKDAATFTSVESVEQAFRQRIAAYVETSWPLYLACLHEYEDSLCFLFLEDKPQQRDVFSTWLHSRLNLLAA